jgi:hypothetical protein
MKLEDLESAERSVVHAGFKFAFLQESETSFRVIVINHQNRVEFQTDNIKELRSKMTRKRARDTKAFKKEAHKSVQHEIKRREVLEARRSNPL